MKKIIIVIITTILFIAKITNVFALEADLETSKNELFEGEIFTISVNVKDAAAWNIHVKASGKVKTEDCFINEANVTEDAKNTNNVFKVICKASTEGVILLNLTGDITSENETNETLNVSKTINVIKNIKTENTSEVDKTVKNPQTGGIEIGIATLIILLLIIVIIKITKKKDKIFEV